MNIRIAALGLLLIAPAALAQKYGQPARTGATERAAMVKTLERGKPIKGSREEYRHLAQVFAVVANSSETPEQAIARTGDSGAQLVEMKGRLVLYRSAQARAASVERFGKFNVYPTVVNARTGTLGVLTGTLIVKPKNMADADAIASSHGLEKIKAYPQLQTVFYRAKAGVDLADASAALQADPRVESAYPEIVEHVRVPK
jgi:Open reading frame 2 N-terminal domain